MLWWSVTGFLFYSTYCLSNYIVQHDSSLGLVQSVEVNDLVFVFHAVLITCFIIWQCYAYKLKSHNLNKIHLGLVVSHGRNAAGAETQRGRTRMKAANTEGTGRDGAALAGPSKRRRSRMLLLL